MSSNTGDNRKPGTFTKADARINRKGRPKSFDAWRSLTVEVLREPAKDKNGNEIIIDGHIATNAEMIARTWLKDPKRQLSLIEAAYGKVPQPVDILAEGKLQVEVNYTQSKIGSSGVSSEPTDNT